MTSIEKFIDSLPKEFQPIAGLYISTLNDMADSEIRAFVDLVATGSWSEAFKAITGRMTTEELLSELERINGLLKELNVENAEFVEIQVNIIKDFLVTSLLFSKSKIGA